MSTIRRDALTVARIGGVPIRIHFTWLFAALYLTVVFAHQLSAMALAAGVTRGELLLAPWVWGVILTLALFASVTLHELAHVAVARRGGAKVISVTLMMLGGVSEIGEVRSPRLERWVAIAGPAASLLLALLASLFYVGIAGGPPDLRFGVYYLAQVNLVVGIFNLLPAFPMDGGRVLRSLLVPHHGRVRATRIAATVGKVCAALMVAGGILVGNLWLVLIAIFVFVGGEAESRAVAVAEALGGLRVGELFLGQIATVDKDATLADAAAAMWRDRAEACLIVDGSEPVGMVTPLLITQVPVRRRAEVPVNAVMRAPRFVDVHGDVTEAMRTLDEQQLDAVIVRDGERLVGALTRDDIVRAIHLREIAAPRT